MLKDEHHKGVVKRSYKRWYERRSLLKCCEESLEEGQSCVTFEV